ncbi:MAG: hypothetical protein J7K12_00065 [Thermoplasmata archaeon]|nr:hypothetical protein [Thermoplasmata archaeon]
MGKLMDTSSPSLPYVASLKLEESDGIWCTTPFQSDAGIQGDVRATLYIEAFFIMPNILPLQLRFIKVSLLDVYNGNADVVASSRVTPLIYLSNHTVKTKTFVINNVDYVIPAGHAVGIKVEKAIDILSYFPFSTLAPFFATNVLYDSLDAPSFVEIPLNISGGGIYIQCYDRQEKVKPGGEAEYSLIIYNNASVEQDVQLSSSYTGNKWSIEMPSVVKIQPNYFNFTKIKVRAPPDAKPGDYLNITITASTGKGSYSIWLNTSVVAYKHGVQVIAKAGTVTGKPGDRVKIPFMVKNTGDLEDTFSLSVKSAWKSELEENQITLRSGESKDVNVYVTIPLNATNGTIKDITLFAKSIKYDVNGSAKCSVKVVYIVTPTPGGESNKMYLIGYILFILGVVALLVIAALLGRVSKKTVMMETEERVAEVTPGKTAEFVIKIKNPLEKLKGGKNKIKYKIGIEGKLPEKWVAKLDREQLILDGREEAEIKLLVSVPKDAPLDEWASINVVVSPSTGKAERLNFLITLREPEPLLKMEYEHEGEMKEGNKVITKIRIRNEGEADAVDKSIAIVVNGKEKNRIDGVTIPVGGEVEIELPWIAEEENMVEIKIT